MLNKNNTNTILQLWRHKPVNYLAISFIITSTLILALFYYLGNLNIKYIIEADTMGGTP
jgi:hypothetical protein